MKLVADAVSIETAYSVVDLVVEILGEALHIRIIIIQNRRLVPLVSRVRPILAGIQL